jgi:diguanylate cyclase (GGDEF)-like protein
MDTTHVRRDRWIGHAAVGLAGAAVYMASPGGGLWELVFAAVGFWAAYGVISVARRDAGESASGLGLIAAGLAAASVGDLLLASYGWRGADAPFPSVADFGYVSGYALLSVGLFVLARRRTSRETLIDSAIVTAGIVGVVWLTVVQPVLEPGLSFETLVALSYPVGSLVLLVASVHLWLGWGFPTVGMRIMGGGLVAWLVADAVYAHQALDGSYVDGTWLDLGWLLAYVFVGAGAMHPSVHRFVDAGHERDPVLNPNRFLLLAVAAAATPAATAIFRLGPVAPLLAVTVFGIVLSAVRLTTPVRQLRHHALQDALTGLANRRVLVDCLQDALDDLGDRGQVALLFCDLDHFKVINDSLGHPAGDELLQVIAGRITSCVRGGATVARLGGDEFVVLFPDIDGDPGVPEAVAARLISEVGQPVHLSSGHTVTPSMSVGIRTTGDRQADVSSLLGDADSAMYAAKRGGRGKAVPFAPAMRQEAVDRLVADTELRRALDEGQLRCVYQPEVDLQTGALFGLEALVRWDHPEHGRLLPDRFIPHAEANGMIDDLFAVVLHHALAAQQRWSKVLGHRPAVAVNVSGAQRVDSTFAATVLGALAAHGAPPDVLWLEITESALVDVDLADALTDLRAAGVRIAVDDFGTGWSSLSRLAASQWDALKIDRSFVADLARLDGPPEVSQVVAATVAMAHALGMLTVAEGVESAAAAALLTELGCDIIQGYHVSVPVDEDEVVGVLQQLDAVSRGD